jgi:hypothetical protein
MDYIKEKYVNCSQKDINELFIIACRNNDLKQVELLLTSQDIPFNAQINMPDNTGCFGICVASGMGRTNIVKFLATSPKLNEKADIHIDNDNAIISAIFSGNNDLIKFFIIDMNIEKTKNIQEAMEEFDEDNYAKKLFEMRELNKHLNQTLSISEQPNKKIKI